MIDKLKKLDWKKITNYGVAAIFTLVWAVYKYPAIAVIVITVVSLIVAVALLYSQYKDNAIAVIRHHKRGNVNIIR